jgi:tetratricopeptide (TPR) repeat protein
MADFLSAYDRQAEHIDVSLLVRLYNQAQSGGVTRRQLGLILARRYLLTGKGRKAVGVYEQLLKEFPDSPVVLERCARVVLQHGEGAASANAFAARAVEIAEEGADVVMLSKALETLAMVQHELNLLTPAHRSIARSVALDPRPVNVLFLAEILAQKGAWLGAERALERALRLAREAGVGLPDERTTSLRGTIETRGASQTDEQTRPPR